MAIDPFTLATAHRLYRTGDLGQADLAYRRLLRDDPGNAELWYLLGEVCQARSRPEEALQCYQEALHLQPDHAGCQNNLGTLFLEQRHFDRAIDCFRCALRLRPDFAEAHNNLGIALLELGRPESALQSFREALRLKPRYSQALNNEGNALTRLNKLAEAVASYQQALHLVPDFLQAHLNLGSVLRSLGRRDEAVTCYRRAVHLQPDLAEAHNDLGIILLELNRHDEAQACFQEALRLQPLFAEPHNNLGVLRMLAGQYEEAIARYQQVLRLKPHHPEALHNLGNSFQHLGRLEEAVETLERAIQLNPRFPKALVDLGMLLSRQGRREEGAVHLRQALALQPDNADVANDLAIVLMELRRVAEAEAVFQQALHHRPDFAEAHNNLGIALLELGRVEEAQLHHSEALRLKPDYAEAHYNLGILRGSQRRGDEAVTCYQQAIRLNPDYASAFNNLGNLYKDQGHLNKALACYRRALDLRPDDATFSSNWLLGLHYLAHYDPASLFREHRRWAERCADTLAGTLAPPPVERVPDRRLRVGYVSPDFRAHVVGNFIETVLRHHDRGHFQIFGYADVPRPDKVTQRIQRSTDTWRSLVGLSDAKAAEVIHADEIDILVDLAGHTGGNRLLVFARKPAPLQVTLFGYPDTTGLKTMDYRLTDAYSDPVGQTDHFYTEKLVRMPGVFWCYQPPDSPEVSPLPANKPGHVTLGSFAYLAKVTSEVLALWTRILHALPHARLLMITGAGRAGDDRVLDELAFHGISSRRVTLCGRQPRNAYLKLCRQADIALDPFPYNGCNTTCDALWMGVPVVALAGDTFISRQGADLLCHLGLTELIAQTPDAYVEITTRLAEDLPRLQRLRSELRPRMRQATLTDARHYTGNLEAALQAMWETRCRGA